MKKIVVVDYGLGNIRSAEQSLKKASEFINDTTDISIVNKASDLKLSTHIVLPGQGAFSSCMSGLKNSPGLIDELSESVLIKKKPFLGICVGMQMLANKGFENGEHSGLGWINGEIKKLPNNNLKLPHMGWNEVLIKKENKLIKEKNNANYYFVHSYFFKCESKLTEVATTSYSHTILIQSD